MVPLPPPHPQPGFKKCHEAKTNGTFGVVFMVFVKKVIKIIKTSYKMVPHPRLGKQNCHETKTTFFFSR